MYGEQPLRVLTTLLGMGSDFIVKRLHGSRFWCLTASGCVFSISQFTGFMLENPKLLVLLSGTNGCKSKQDL